MPIFRPVLGMSRIMRTTIAVVFPSQAQQRAGTRQTKPDVDPDVVIVAE
jgi:hypothetical protein